MWETPKTDWKSSFDSDGKYTGDKFNAVDYNRIKNNLEYLRGIAVEMYEEFSITSVGDDKTPKDYFYADEINQMEENLNVINQHTLSANYGTTPVYYDNGNTMDYTELNRLESAILDLYNKLTNEYEGRRLLTFNFGMNGGL
jgi:hypothetical protein